MSDDPKRFIMAAAGGLVVPVAVLGFLAQFPVDPVLGADLAFALSLMDLYTACGDGTARETAPDWSQPP